MSIHLHYHTDTGKNTTDVQIYSTMNRTTSELIQATQPRNETHSHECYTSSRSILSLFPFCSPRLPISSPTSISISCSHRADRDLSGCFHSHVKPFWVLHLLRLLLLVSLSPVLLYRHQMLHPNLYRPISVPQTMKFFLSLLPLLADHSVDRL
jgi:hypothetical protein